MFTARDLELHTNHRIQQLLAEAALDRAARDTRAEPPAIAARLTALVRRIWSARRPRRGYPNGVTARTNVRP